MGKTCLRNKEEGLSGATREASQGGQLLSAEGEHGVRGTGWSGGQAMGSGSCLACAVGKEGGVCVCACLCVHTCVCACVRVCVCVLSLAWICGPMDCSLLGFCGLPFPPPGDLSNPEIKPESCVSCMGRLILYHCAAREARSVQLRLYKILEKAKLWRQ